MAQRRPIAVLSAALIAACSNPLAGAIPVRQYAAKTATARAYVLESCLRKTAACPKAGGFVQILGGDTITHGVENPVAIAVDASGDLYVGNRVTRASGSITIYSNGSTHPSDSIAHVKGDPHGLSVDGTGQVYVASQYAIGCCRLRSRIARYVPGDAKPLHVLWDVAAFAGAPAFDASGNLYVQNFSDFPGYVAVYPSARRKPSQVLRAGIGFPERLAVMPDGTLFVLNRKFGHSSDILVFAPGSGTASRRIVAGLDRPLAIAVDAGGNLYVADEGRRKHTGHVTVYAAGGTAVTRIVREGIDRPVDLAVDASGHLWVANAPAFGVNTIAVYAPTASSPSKTYRLVQPAIRIVVL